MQYATPRRGFHAVENVCSHLILLLFVRPLRYSGRMNTHAKHKTAISFNHRPYYIVLILVLFGLLWWLKTELAKPVPPHVQVKELHAIPTRSELPVADVAGRTSIRVASYNIEHFTDAKEDGDARTDELLYNQSEGAAAIIAESNADILVLQEIENKDVLVFLNSQLPDPYPFVYITQFPPRGSNTEKLNLALFSRFKPSRVRELNFSQLPYKGRPARGLLAAEFDLDEERTLLVYDMHLKSNFGEDSRNQAHRAIALHVLGQDALTTALQLAPKTVECIALGDTNVDPELRQFSRDPSLGPLSGAFADLWLGTPLSERTTLPSRVAGDPYLVFMNAAFDRVFASAPLQEAPWMASKPHVIQRGVNTSNNLAIPGQDGHVSDHYLVYVDLLK